MIPGVLILANAFEWWVHKNLLHKRRVPLHELFDRHTPLHHYIYEYDSMSMRSTREFRLVLIPAVGVLGVVLLAAPIAFALSRVVGSNAAWLFLGTDAAYMSMYELLHLSYHLPSSHPIARIGVIRRLSRQHTIHHRKALMQTKNFNVTFPLFDWILGTLENERSDAS
jgi:sterol desaturase/sphingolipid hydroxylase (fatty acid hydroxylase superfamily)